MKTKNTKIKITKNKIITEDNTINENEYDFTGDFKAMGKAVVDSVKSTYQTLKRMFFAVTLGVKSLNALRKGDLEKMDKLREEFLLSDQLLKQEQESLIRQQPGSNDLQLFLSMTSPGAVMFDKFLNINKPQKIKQIKKFFMGDENERMQELRSKAAYHNLIMTISEVIYGTSVTLNMQREITRTKKVRKAPKEAIENIKKKDFKKALSYLGTFYSHSTEDSSLYFSIGENTYEVLYAIYNEQPASTMGGGGIIDLIIKNNLSYEIEQIVSKLSNVTTRSKFKVKIENLETSKMEDLETAKTNRKEEEIKKAEEAQAQQQQSAQQQSDNLKIILRKNQIIINESDMLEEGIFDFFKGTKVSNSIKQVKDIIGDTDEPLKDTMEASFSFYYCAKSYLYTIQLHNLLKRNAMFLNFKVQNLKDFNDFNPINDKSINSLQNLSDEIVGDCKKIKNTTEKFNNLFEEKISVVKLDKIEEISNEFVKGSNDINNKYNELSKDTNPKEKKKLCYSMILTILESEDIKKMEQSPIYSTAQKSFDIYNKNVEFYISNIDESKIKKYSKYLVEARIPENYATEIELRRREINSFLIELKKSEKTFTNFLNEYDTIKRELDELEQSLDSEEESSDDTSGIDDENSEIIDGPKTKTQIVSQDIVDKQ